MLALLGLLLGACGPTRPAEPPAADRDCVASCTSKDTICEDNVRGDHWLRADSPGSVLPAVVDLWIAHLAYRRCTEALARCWEGCPASP